MGAGAALAAQLRSKRAKHIYFSEVELNAQKWRPDLPRICRFNFGIWVN